jgi:putative ABC transport system permease protein
MTTKARTRYSLADATSDAVVHNVRRADRLIASVASLTVGVAAVIATLNLQLTAGNAVNQRFAALGADDVKFSPQARAAGGQPTLVDLRAVARLMSEPAFVGLTAITSVGKSSVFNGSSGAPEGISLDVLHVGVYGSGGVSVSYSAGRACPGMLTSISLPCAVLGSIAAERLGLTGSQVRRGADIVLAGARLHIAGIAEATGQAGELLSAVWLPYKNTNELTRVDSIYARSSPGAAAYAARIGPFVLDPPAPQYIGVESAIGVLSTRAGVGHDLGGLSLALSLCVLVLGALGISNAISVSVIERRGEIGLRRAVGATSRHIRHQVMVEAALLGIVGAVLGLIIGVAVISAVAHIQRWVPVANVTSVWAPVGLATIMSTVASMAPSRRASKISPVQALRSN